MYCSNCNCYGHSNKKCQKPINSIGVIYECKNKIILVNRKYSHYYVKLLNFNFSLNEIDYIKTIVAGLTEYEYKLICSYPYEVLWKSVTVPFLINSNDNTLNKSNFSSKKHRYNKLLNGYTVDGEYLKLCDLYQTTLHVKYPNWELPKGKRIAYESDATTALREFKEETGTNNDIILDENNYHEIFFTGWDKQQYSQCFYYYKDNKQINLYIDSFNYVQSSEINKCGWFSLDEIKEKKLFEGMDTDQHSKTMTLLHKLLR
jgi:8-oxo-dGTP pyrophosphatase MutT (NUDIX family)